MIFVTVGNPKQGFRRLLNAVDKLAGEGVFGNETIFIQSGNNLDFRPIHCGYKPFLTMEDFTNKAFEAEMIICHAGAGTLFHVLRAGKVPVVMPRCKQYGEHVDNHQVELVKALTGEGRIIAAYEPENLPAAIAEAMRRNVQQAPLPPSRMLSLVAKAIEELLKRKL